MYEYSQGHVYEYSQGHVYEYSHDYTGLKDGSCSTGWSQTHPGKDTGWPAPPVLRLTLGKTLVGQRHLS